MRIAVWSALIAAGVLGLGCHSNTVYVPVLAAPQNLTYELDPSGDPNQPAGILLVWDPIQGQNLASYRVYSRASTSGAFGLRGETSSSTFHDNGVPDLQYYVTAVDVNGGESSPSTTVTIDERLQLAAPSGLSSTALNGAIALVWPDNAFLDAPQRFKWYRVYSASYDMTQGLCGIDWALEGTTVSPEFLVGALDNGVPRCFGISAISVEGYESLWSPLQQNTPRPDARNVLLYANEVKPDSSGFRFWNDFNGDGVGQPNELGLVQSGAQTGIDFWIHLQSSDSSLWLVPETPGDSIVLYGNAPVADLTSIGTAPASGYTGNMIEAVPGYGYVFQRLDATGLHYGAVRVTHVGRQYLILDWSYQTDPGNPDLVIRAGLPTAAVGGATAKAGR